MGRTRPRRPAGQAQRSGRRRWAVAGALLAAGFISALVAFSFHSASKPQTPRLALGAIAPGGSFTTVQGTHMRISSLQGHPALVWFVSTDCGSCEAGTQAMAAHIDAFAHRGVKVVELRLADNLGAGGTDIGTFGRQLTGTKFTQPDWVWGEASRSLTATYDPNGYLDVYYLLDAHGRIVDVNSSPDSTMDALLHQISALKAAT
jgi:hypothetical protein